MYSEERMRRLGYIRFAELSDAQKETAEWRVNRFGKKTQNEVSKIVSEQWFTKCGGAYCGTM